MAQAMADQVVLVVAVATQFLLLPVLAQQIKVMLAAILVPLVYAAVAAVRVLLA
jgi:hypothetical protein